MGENPSGIFLVVLPPKTWFQGPFHTVAQRDAQPSVSFLAPVVSARVSDPPVCTSLPTQTIAVGADRVTICGGQTFGCVQMSDFLSALAAKLKPNDNGRWMALMQWTYIV